MRFNMQYSTDISYLIDEIFWKCLKFEIFQYLLLKSFLLMRKNL